MPVAGASASTRNYSYKVVAHIRAVVHPWPVLLLQFLGGGSSLDIFHK